MRKLCGLLLAVVVVAGCKKEPAPDAVIGGPRVDQKKTDEVIAAPSDQKTAEESCVSDWLKTKKLDEYGSQEGTMYAGGSPLFDEATGKSRNRLELVYDEHPDAKTACAPKPKAP